MPYAFGNQVTDFNQIAIGTNGYVIVADLSGNLLDEMVAVQMTNGTTLSTYQNVGSQVSDVYGFPQNAIFPTLAWYRQGNTVIVFVSSSAYPFVSSNRIAFWFYRTPIDLKTIGDSIDVPPKYINLFMGMTIRRWRQTNETFIRYDVDRQIQLQKNLLGLTFK